METNKDHSSTEHKDDRALAILMRKLEEAKSRNPHFSLRAFSQRLGISSGALSEILKGKRPLSNTTKQKIAKKLFLSPQESIEFFQKNLPGEMGLISDDRLTLSQDHFHLISDWWYFGLLNLIKTRNFKNQLSWMASRLGLSLTTVADAWDRLLRLGYIEKKGNKIFRKHPNIKTGENILANRKSHISDLPLIEKALYNVPPELRDNTSCTFVIDKKDLSRAKELIRIFQSQFLNQIGKESGDEVYKMTIAVYPLTQVEGDSQ